MASAERVLVIESDAGNLDLLAIALRRAGFEVFTASSGEDGLQAAAREKPHCVLIDLDHPRMDGLDIVRAIRRLPESSVISIIAITTDASKGACRGLLDAGWRGCLEKPIDPLAISRKIRDIIDRSA